MSGQARLAPPVARVDLPALLPSALLPGPPAGPGSPLPDDAGRTRRTVRDWLVDLLGVVLAFAYGALVVWVGDATAPEAAVPWPVDAGIGALCCAGLWLRRRWPVGVAVAIACLATMSAMATGAMAIALFTVAVHRRASTALLIGVLNVLVAPIYALQQTHPKYSVWVDLGVRLVITAATVGWGMFARARRQLVLSLREHAARLEAEQHLRVDQVRLTERARIAREMHDVLAHRMSLVSLHAGVLEVRTDARPEEVATAAGVIRANAHEALQELRAVIGVLRADVSGGPERPQPGLPDIPELIEDAGATGMRVRYTGPALGTRPSALAGRTAYRIVQEGLTNARKHAPGAAVQVLVDGGDGERLRVRITNPFPLPAARLDVPGAGLGLVGLSERVALAGGRFEYGPDADGFRVEAWLPW